MVVYTVLKFMKRGKNMFRNSWKSLKVLSFVPGTSLGVFVLGADTQATTDGPRGPGGASRVSGGRDDSRSHSTKRRWIPPSTVRRDALSQENKNDLIFRKVRGILNKLTPEKFQKLSDDLLQTELNSSVILKGVILLIFEKALDEPKYSSMYAQLCKRLSEEAPNFEPPSSPCCTFRLLLLNKCRAEFENRSKATEAFEQRDGPLAPEEEERRQLAKRKMLGNIKFIGELGKLEILAEGILHRCIQQLLDKKKKGSSKDTAEDLECLSQIMRTCGRILDSEKGKKLMNQYFERMQMLADSVELPLRIRFMLRDVIELRRDRWVPRKATSTEGPMPIHQMREEEQGRRGGYHQHHQQHQHHRAELFGPGLKRSGLEDVLGTLPLSGPSLAPSMPPSFGSNGYQPGGFRQNRQQNFYSGGSNRQNFSQNHGKTNHNINSSQQQNFTASSGTGKDLPPRFKKLAHQVGQAALEEEVSLRPAANTMVFKQPGAKQSLLSAGRPGSVTLGDPLPQLKPGPSLPLLKEPPILIKQASLDKNKGPSKEEVLRKAEGLLEEYLSSSRLQDAVSAYREQKVPDKFARPVLLAMMSATLDRSDADRDLASALMVELRKEGLVSPAHFLEAYRDLVAQAADKEQEVPRVYSHVAGLAAAAVGKELVSLGEVAEPTESGAHYPLFLLTLQQLHRLLGRAPLTQMFLDSKVNLLNQLPEADRTKERLAEILEERGLTFLFPLLRIQAELWKQLLADPNPTQFYKWIKENLDPAHHSDPPFISALVTVLLKYITQESTLAEGVDCSAAPEKALQEKEKALLERYKPVLQAFLHERTDLQVTAVYSLQVFCFGLHFPKGMLLRWFVNLYDLEIVEEEAFLKWKEDITDDYPGKGKALFQVNQWLTWLAEAESEEEDEEGDI
ncbi:eukaryotic translation initiation factor 4 gamma 2 isoform X2 [Bacillus rossius redtenbacheri]|uniref:eukaryotic translation initiation factor 4 gamma 2 isoform X2 n=1 Tax=Bacillus rossius redtenbacheri TaxID=93214 RepID=UPI002FDCE18B